MKFSLLDWIDRHGGKECRKGAKGGRLEGPQIRRAFSASMVQSLHGSCWVLDFFTCSKLLPVSTPGGRARHPTTMNENLIGINIHLLG